MARGSLETWVFVLFIVAVVVIPILVGLGFFKLYRLLRPFADTPQQPTSFTYDAPSDSFFKCTFVGWLICAPLFYLVYTYL
ncbi:hypothetical protein GCM10027170_19580 [Aliiglaciecola aliphaticivorans]